MKKRLFISSILMTLVLLVAITTATFAWYQASTNSSPVGFADNMNQAVVTTAGSYEYALAAEKTATVTFVENANNTRLVMATWDDTNTKWDVKFLNRALNTEMDGELHTNLWVDDNDHSKGTYNEVAAKVYQVKIAIDTVLTADELQILSEQSHSWVKVVVSATQSDDRIMLWGSNDLTGTHLVDGASYTTGGLTFYIQASSLTASAQIIGYVAVAYEGHTDAVNNLFTADTNAPAITLHAAASLVSANNA